VGSQGLAHADRSRPRRANYPDLYRFLILEQLWGSYDVPGWTANGIEPWGLQMDPIGADGNLFFKGFFLVMLGLHLRTTGDERWNQPFDMVRDGENTFTWFRSAIAAHVHRQWTEAPAGCHCGEHEVAALHAEEPAGWPRVVRLFTRHRQQRLT
jgi:hypothetical protein